MSPKAWNADSRSTGILGTDGTQGRWIGRQFVLSSRILVPAQEGRKDVHVLVGAQAARIALGGVLEDLVAIMAFSLLSGGIDVLVHGLLLAPTGPLSDIDLGLIPECAYVRKVALKVLFLSLSHSERP